MCIRDRSEVMHVIGEIEGRNCVVMDDMIDTAGTLVKAAEAVSYTHLRAHETPEHIVCRLLLEKKKKKEKTYTVGIESINE